MKCEKCHSKWRDEPGDLILMDELEIQRYEGNNYDVVIYEQRYQCDRCSQETVTQETIRECATTMDYTMDDQSSSPARFGT